MSSCKNQIASKEKEKEKNKQAQQSTTSSLTILVDNNAHQTNSSEKTLLIQFPDLPALPVVGRLYLANSQSFLAIQYWEEYEQGQKEATRLNANLCTTKN